MFPFQLGLLSLKAKHTTPLLAQWLSYMANGHLLCQQAYDIRPAGHFNSIATMQCCLLTRLTAAAPTTVYTVCFQSKI